MTAIPAIDAGIDQVLSIWVIDSPALQDPNAPTIEPVEDCGSECILETVAGPVERFYIYSHPVPGQDGKVRTVISPEDRFGNPGSFETPVTIKLNWNSKSWSETITESTILYLDAPEGIGRLQAAIPMKALSVSEKIMNGARSGNDLVVTGNPVWAHGPDGLVPAFGEFHWHTEMSGDGQRPIAEALRSARDLLNLDWVAPSDHSTSGENWIRTVQAMEEFNSADNFATFFGWESSTLTGHENYYFTDPDHPLVCGGKAGFSGGDVDQVISLLTKYHDFIGASVQDALGMGYKPGFTGGTDNHCGWPGRAYAECEQEGIHPFKSVILTGVWTGRVERQKVYDALYARHTWAVWDTRAIVHFTLNGAMAGDEVTVSADDELVAHVKLSAEDSLQSIEIISDGNTVWESSIDELDIDIDVPLGKVYKSTHFYLRAMQRNGGIIYASPVFVSVHEGASQTGSVSG